MLILRLEKGDIAYQVEICERKEGSHRGRNFDGSEHGGSGRVQYREDEATAS